MSAAYTKRGIAVVLDDLATRQPPGYRLAGRLWRRDGRHQDRPALALIGTAEVDLWLPHRELA